MEQFAQGYRLQEADLRAEFWARGLYYPSGLSVLYSPDWVRYEITYYHAGEDRYLRLGSPDRIPKKIKTGVYRANLIIGENWVPGVYRIAWKYRVTDVAPEQSFFSDFEILSRGVSSPTFVVSYCRFNLPATVEVLDSHIDLPGSFLILPNYRDLTASFTII